MWIKVWGRNCLWNIKHGQNALEAMLQFVEAEHLCKVYVSIQICFPKLPVSFRDTCSHNLYTAAYVQMWQFSFLPKEVLMFILFLIPLLSVTYSTKRFSLYRDLRLLPSSSLRILCTFCCWACGRRGCAVVSVAPVKVFTPLDILTFYIWDRFCTPLVTWNFADFPICIFNLITCVGTSSWRKGEWCGNFPHVQQQTHVGSSHTCISWSTDDNK
jgi:hypothetical protein